MKKTAFVLMMLTILSKVIGFSRDIILSYFYGASYTSDAYLIALTIPTVIFTFVGIGISTTFIPIFSHTLTEEGEEKAQGFTNNVINSLVVISTLIVTGVLLFTEPIVKLFASGFEGETLELAVTLTGLTIMSIYISGIIYVFRGYLQVKNNFVAPVLIGVPLNIFLIASIVLSTKTGLTVLGYGKIIAVVAQLLFLMPFLIKKGYRYTFKLDFRDPKLKKMVALSLPVILGTSVNQINMLVDRTLASQVAVGGISALNYAHQLNRFVQGIFVVSISTVLFASMSSMAAKKNIEGIKKTLAESINVINLLVLPTMVGAMIFAEPIVSMLFGRGQFDSRAVVMTAETLFFYSIGMIALGLREVLSRTFYSLQDTKTPMINASIGMALNIVLNFILVRYLGLGGLALATSIAAIVITILLFTSLRKKIGPFGLASAVRAFLKMLVAAAVMGVLARISFSLLNTVTSQNLSLLGAIAIGALTYFGMIYALKIEDMDLFVDALRKRFSNK